MSETKAKISLQSLLYRTTEQIFKMIGEGVEARNYNMIAKWGWNGTSDQARYKQAFRSDPSSTTANWSETR